MNNIAIMPITTYKITCPALIFNNRLLNNMLSGWCFGCKCFDFCYKDAIIIKKYGIEEKRLLNKEIIEVIESVDEEKYENMVVQVNEYLKKKALKQLKV